MRFCCSAPPWDACCSWFCWTTLPLVPETFQKQPSAKDHSCTWRTPKPPALDVLCRLLPPFGEALRFYAAGSSHKKQRLKKARPSLAKAEAEADLSAQVRLCRVLHPPGSTRPVERELWTLSGGVCHRTSVLSRVQPPRHCILLGYPGAGLPQAMTDAAES